MNQHNEDCKLIHADEWIFDTPDTPYPTDFQPALRQCDEGSPYLDMAMEHCSILTDSAGKSVFVWSMQCIPIPLTPTHIGPRPGLYRQNMKSTILMFGRSFANDLMLVNQVLYMFHAMYTYTVNTNTYRIRPRPGLQANLKSTILYVWSIFCNLLVYVNKNKCDCWGIPAQNA